MCAQAVKAASRGRSNPYFAIFRYTVTLDQNNSSAVLVTFQFSVLRAARSTPEGPSLTPRQREILQLIAEGRTAKEIATLLNISTRTVEGHKYEIMGALEVKTSAELVRQAVKLGLIIP